MASPRKTNHKDKEDIGIEEVFHILCKIENKLDNIYTLCGIDENGKTMAIVTYYSDDDNAPNKSVKLDFGRCGNYEIYALDSEKDGELVGTTSDLTFDLGIHSSDLIKEI